MNKLLSGNEAIAQGAYKSGVAVATGYPGTPATEIMESLSKFNEVYCEWSPNEKVALEVAFGASFGGKRSLAVMKHVGLNVASDPLMSISYTGVNGGLVIVTADDPGMHSSQNEQDNRNYAKFAKIPMFEPSDSQEAKDMTIKAFEVSEKFDTPVLLRTTTRISHSKSVVESDEKRKENNKELKKNSSKYVMIPTNAIKRHSFVEARLKKLENLSNKLSVIEYKDKSVGIVTSGVCYGYAKDVFPDASFLKINMTYPLPFDIIKSFSDKVDKLYVIEELDPFIEEQLKAEGIKLIGKEKLSVEGELSPDIIRNAFLKDNINEYSDDQLKTPKKRLPKMCNGCSHIPIFQILKKLDVVVMGDIGCYTLAALPPLNSMDVQLNMGLSIGSMHGLDKALGKDISKKAVAVIGDSTFIHSGITSLINVVYNKGISTIIILDNRSTAMTGFQDHPSTGFTIDGSSTKQIDLANLVKSIGITNIKIVDPYNAKETEKIIKEELAKEEPSVIITNQPCLLNNKEGTK
jgi:indolepyruvate ferredoxin oxidoreductase alpha subunit